LKQRIVAAQSDALEAEFQSAHDLCARALADLKIAIRLPRVGNTLRGHRSMAGVLKAAPEVVVLVGEAAFRELTGSVVGPQLLLRLYQSSFDVASRQTGYSFQRVVSAIFMAFRERADELEEGFLESVLYDAISGDASQQDSRSFAPVRRRRGASEA
jgi:hypothetical protein